MTKHKTYSGSYKLKVVLEVLTQEQPISAIASKYQITPKNIHNWKKQLSESAPELFSSGHSKQDKSQEALVAKLYQQIGQLTVERDFLSDRSGL